MNDTPIMLIIRNLYIIFRLIDNFPTLTGDSKQVRDLLDDLHFLYFIDLKEKYLLSDI